MAQAGNSDVIDAFEEFYRTYYRDEIGDLARRYPDDQRSLYVSWRDLYRYDADLAEDVRTQPDQFIEYAEEALRLYDLPVDVALGQAHVRIRDLSQTVDIRSIRARHRGNLVAIQGIVRKATDVRPKVREAAFECQRCGTLTRITQPGGAFEEPHECGGCERQGPFRINYDQSEFVDSQKLRVQESPEGLRGGETPQSIDINIEDDITGKVTAGDNVRVTGVLHLDQQESGQQKSAVFDVYMDGMAVEIEDEQFEDMEITEADKQEIIELSEEEDIYQRMIDSLAPSIYGYEQEKLAIILQLFSGVTKHLPDGSRLRGDLHVLLVGDPGTGKSKLLQYIRNLAPRSVYTSGKGASSAGLTAAAVRDDFGDGQQWTLEAGALVLADQGIAAVDELDKMACVTGDTRVHRPAGVDRIDEIAARAAATGTVESVANGRRIRDVDLDVWTMTDAGRIVRRPVTTVHEYEPPSTLVELTLTTGESLTATADHPCFVREDGRRVERPAGDLSVGDRLYVPERVPPTRADGGESAVAPTPASDAAQGARDGDGDAAVTWRPIASIRTVAADDATRVYDLTVDGTHNFLANGLVVHNSDDQSAMHEALEQQSYHPEQELFLADGRREPIGALVDDRMAARPDDVVEGVDCEILPVDDLRVHSTAVDAGTTTKHPVDRVSRHEAPDEFVRVTFSNGRSVLVTPEHPLFVADDDTVGTVPARAVESGALVPAPRKLPNSATPVTLDDEPDRSGTGDHERGDGDEIDPPDELSGALAELVGLLVAAGEAVTASDPESGSVSESRSQSECHEITVTSHAECVRERAMTLMRAVFGIEAADANTAERVTWRSTPLYRWLERNVPAVLATADERRLPAPVLGAGEDLIRRCLVGAFAAASGGGEDNESMAVTAATRRLAEDYADALAKIGVAARIDRDTAADAWQTSVLGDSTARFVDRVVEPVAARYDDAAVDDAPGVTSDRAAAPADRAPLRYYRVAEVETVPNAGEYATDWVYDVTVTPTNTFVGQGVVLHNSISISKAGINATLKARCSLLGAANPIHGRFDEYESIGEQIDLEPPLISRFDLIFTVTDNPDEERDRELAEHIIQTNYAGELQTHRTQTATPNVSQEEVDEIGRDVEPSIDPDLLRKYVAYAKRNCYPTMTEAARTAIREFYVDLRMDGQGDDTPVPVTARKLEALVRLAEASARVRLSDTVEEADARRVIDIVRASMEDVGMDPETGELDADIVETGTSKSQRDRIKNIKGIITDLEAEHDEGAPVEEVLDRAEAVGMERSKAEREIEKLRRQGDVYEPRTDHLRTV